MRGDRVCFRKSGVVRLTLGDAYIPTRALSRPFRPCRKRSDLCSFQRAAAGFAKAVVTSPITPAWHSPLSTSVAQFFLFFNFRQRGKAMCIAGDVGSVGIAFIVLFAIGMLIARTGDITWLIFLLVYGVDGCLTICHRIMLHEKLGEAHRKHAYQLMANELKMSHPLVSVIYMAIQLVVSLGFIFLIPDTPLAHWLYLVCALIVLCIVYVLFMKKYYHLHEEYLASLKK